MKVKELESITQPNFDNCALGKLKALYPVHLVGRLGAYEIIAVSIAQDDNWVYLFARFGELFRKVKELEVDRPASVEDLGRVIIALNH